MKYINSEKDTKMSSSNFCLTDNGNFFIFLNLQVLAIAIHKSWAFFLLNDAVAADSCPLL